MKPASLMASVFMLVMIAACSDDSPPAQTGTKMKTAGTIDGGKIYADKCAACHDAGPGHPGTMRLAVRLGKDRAVLTQREDLDPMYVGTVVRQGMLMMPPFRPSEINDAELQALALFLSPQETD